MKSIHQARNKQIYHLVKNTHLRLTTVGGIFNISRQRVWQIVMAEEMKLADELIDEMLATQSRAADNKLGKGRKKRKHSVR